MANFVYTRAATNILKGDMDFDGHDFRVALVMTNTTADTERDAATIDAFTTLDEMDGANYARVAISGEEVNEDTGNDRAEFDDDDSNVTFSSLGAGTRQVQGAVVLRHITDDTDSVPVCWIDTGGFPFTANGSDVVIQFNAEGILQATTT